MDALFTIAFLLLFSSGVAESQAPTDPNEKPSSPEESQSFPQPLLVTMRSMRRPIQRGNRITRLPLPMDVPPTDPLIPLPTSQDSILSTQDVEPVLSVLQTLYPTISSTTGEHQSLQSLLEAAENQSTKDEDLPQSITSNIDSTTEQEMMKDSELPSKTSEDPKPIFSITVTLHPLLPTTSESGNEESQQTDVSATTESAVDNVTTDASVSTSTTEENSTLAASTSSVAPESLPENNRTPEENEISPSAFSPNHEPDLSFTELLPRVTSLVDHWCFDCLCQASSNCENVGCTEGVCGSYQLSLPYWIDAGKPQEQNGFETCALNKTCSQVVIENVMNKYHRDCNNDGVIDCYDFALIHKAGPNHCESQWPLETLYWTRFTECQTELEAVKPFNVQSGTTQASISRQDSQTVPPIVRPQPLGGILSQQEIPSPQFQPQKPQVPLFPQLPTQKPQKPTDQPSSTVSEQEHSQGQGADVQPQIPEHLPQGSGLQEFAPQIEGQEQQGFQTQTSVQPLKEEIIAPQRPELIQSHERHQQSQTQRPPVISQINPQASVDNNFINSICFDCLCYASSNCEDVGCGAACGPYQISHGYWTDAGRPGFRIGFEACAQNRSCAEQTIVNYMRKYRRDCNGDGVIDCFDYALIHKAGPLNCRSEWPLQTPYWAIFTECHSELSAETSQGVQTTIKPIPQHTSQPQLRPSQQGPQPGRPSQQGPQPGRPSQQGPQPGTPSQQGPQPARPSQQGPQPGRPSQQGPQPGTPSQQGPQPGRPSQQGPQPGRPSQQGPQSGRPDNQTPPKPSQKPNEVIKLQNHTIERVCLDCLCYAMTECKNIGCQGDVCGPYKITRAYWTDAGKPGKVNPDLPQAYEVCALDQDCSELAVQGYINRFAKDCNNDGFIDCLDFARIHIAGPYACDGKWVETTFLNRKFMKCYEESINGVSGQGRLQFAHAFDYPGDEGPSPHLPLPPMWRKPPVQNWRVPPPPNFGSYSSRSQTNFRGNAQGDLNNQQGSFFNRAQGTDSRTFHGSFANGQSRPSFQPAASQQSQFFNRSSSSSNSQESSSEFFQQSSSSNQFQNNQGFQQPPPHPNFQSNFETNQNHKINWNGNGQNGFFSTGHSQGSTWDNNGGHLTQTGWNNGNHNQQQHNQGTHWHQMNFEHQHWNQRPPFPRFKPRPPPRLPPWHRKPIPPWRPPVPQHHNNWDTTHFKHETFQTAQQNFENEDNGYKNFIPNNGHPPHPPHPAFHPHPPNPYGPPEPPVNPIPQPEQPVPQQPLQPPQQQSPAPPPSQTEIKADKTSFKNETRETFYNKSSFSQEEFESKTETEANNQAASNPSVQSQAPQSTAPNEMKTQTRELSYNKSSSKHEEHESKVEKFSSSEQASEAAASPSNNVPAPAVSPPSSIQPSSEEPSYNKESNAETQASTSTAAATSASQQSTTTAASTTVAQSSAAETQATEATTKKTETEEATVENKTSSEQKKETNFEKTEKVKEKEEETFEENKAGSQKKETEIEKTEANSTKEESKFEQESSVSQNKEEASTTAASTTTTTVATTTTEATTMKVAAASKEAETTAFKNESHKLSFENSSTSMSQSSSKFKEELSAAAADSSASQASASQASGRSVSDTMAAASSILVPVHQMPPWIVRSKTSSTVNSFEPNWSVKIDRSCLNCICQASTGCRQVDCEGPFCGPYSITSEFWEKAGKPGIHWGQTTQEGHYNCANDISCAELTIQRYMDKFQRDCNDDQVIDCSDFARLHQAGANHCDANWIDISPFWSKFQQCRQKQRLTEMVEGT